MGSLWVLVRERLTSMYVTLTNMTRTLRERFAIGLARIGISWLKRIQIMCTFVDYILWTNNYKVKIKHDEHIKTYQNIKMNKNKTGWLVCTSCLNQHRSVSGFVWARTENRFPTVFFQLERARKSRNGFGSDKCKYLYGKTRSSCYWVHGLRTDPDRKCVEGPIIGNKFRGVYGRYSARRVSVLAPTSIIWWVFVL